MTATIKFDFTHYLPNQDPNATIVKLSSGQCLPNNFVAAVVCSNLVPGKAYEITYQLLNPSTNPGNPINIFNPPIQNIFASFATQKFATLADLEVQGEYILQATLKDIAANVQTSAIISLQCGDPAQPTPTPTMTPTVTPSRLSRQNNVTVSIVDPDFDPIPDNVVTLPSGVHEFPLIAIANNAIIGSKYSYEFFELPSNSIWFEKKTGDFYAGAATQNFNTKIALSGIPKYAYVYATIRDVETNVVKYSEPTLFRYTGNNSSLCTAVLPTGLDLRLGAQSFRTCNLRGLTTNSISFISGGSGFSIGDTLTTVGGGGFGAELEVVSGGITAASFSSLSGGTGFNIGDFLEVTGGGGSGGLIQIVSGSITKESITALTGSTGFQVGDLLTTVGGGGEGVVIRVTAVNPVTGAITDFEVLNGGHGFTFAPSGLVAITGSGTVTNVIFNADNFGIPAAGGITADSIVLSGGSGFDIGEVLNIDGGGGDGAQIQVVAGSLTTASINSLGGGTGFQVGDYVTTTGGGGEGVVIRITSIGPNGSITGWELVNGGFGFTGEPTGIVALTGTGVNASIIANDTNFAIQTAGQITESSISNLIGSGTGYTVGDRLIVTGGGGSGAIIEITAVGPNGQILDYVIINGGSGYSSNPIVLNEDGSPIAIQPSWNISAFTDPGFVIINAGSGYFAPPTVISSATGNGSGVAYTFNVEEFTDPAFIVVNSGSGYTSAPTGLEVVSGDGEGFTVSFNDTQFTIPATGGITPESIVLSGGGGYNIGDQISIEGGGGTGAVVQVVSGSLTTQSINSLSGGTGYVVGDYLTTTGGGGEGVVIRVTSVGPNGNITGWEIVNAGYGFVGEPTGLVSLTGSGVNAVLVANDDNFSLTKESGLTENALQLTGGTGYNIGERITLGGGDTPAQIEIISGSLSTQSINSLTGGTGYLVGDLLTTTGGGGEGVVIRVTAIGANGSITGWEILNAGYGFVGEPTGLVALTGSGAGAVIVANDDNFSLTEPGGITKDSINGLIGTSNTPAYTVGTQLYITGGGGSGAIIRITSVDNTGKILDYVIIDSGSGYDGSTSFVVRTGSVSGLAVTSQPSFDVMDFTENSFIVLDQGSGFDSGIVTVSSTNGNGSGGSLAIDSDELTDKSFVIIDSGSGYTSTPTIITSKTGNGGGVTASFDVNEFSEPAIVVTNPGSGYLDSPTGLQVVTGYGVISTVEVEFNDTNFIEITGTPPTPTPTPTVTPTPSISMPAPCNDLQTAGGQNDIYLVEVARPAPSGQNFLIVENSPALQIHSIVVHGSVQADTNVVLVENYYSSIADEANLKKITLNRPLSGAITAGSIVTVYTVDVRIIKTAYWPGNMTFTYDAYSVPDRFKVIGIPVDQNQPQVLLYDSGFRGSQPCGYANNIAGQGSGSVSIFKPDGMIYVKVIVEAPCEGTAWEYLLACPTRSPLLTSTPTPTRSPTPTPSTP